MIDVDRTNGIDGVIIDLQEKESRTENLSKTWGRVETEESTTVIASVYNVLAKASINLKV